MIESQGVLQAILEHAEPRAPHRVPLIEGVGRILAEDIRIQNNGHPPLSRGTSIDAAVVEQLARARRENVRVFGSPCLAVITVGGGDWEEVMGLTLSALAREAGMMDTHLFHADRVPEDLAFVLDHVANADLVLLVGNGAELGLQAVTHYGAEVVLDGREVLDFELMLATRGSQLIFGLPREPTAARACFVDCVVPAARRMEGRAA